MPVDRLLPSEVATELIALTRDIADKVLDPIVDAHEHRQERTLSGDPAEGSSRTGP